MEFTVKDLSINALIGALYFVLVYVFSFMSFGEIQFRIAEALLIFLLFNKKLAPGLILGNFLASLAFSPYGIVDALFGTLASFVAIVLMILTKKLPLLSFIFPALINGIIIGAFITCFSDTIFIINFSTVFIGEFVVLYLVGLPLYYYINKNDHIIELLK